MSGSPSENSRPWLFGEGLPVTILAAAKFLFHLYASRSYGYFTDELYYLACSRHLAWGYVDQPPLIALIAAVERSLLGDSLPAIRFLGVLAGAATVLLTGLIARDLGGRRFAQATAALCTLLAPGFLAIDSFLSMNVFEPLFWLGCALILIRMIKTGNTKLWLWFGLIAGIGVENKHSMLIFGFGIVAGLLLTPERRLLFNRWMWMGGVIVMLLFLPNLIWNIQHHFPFIEIQRNILNSGRNVALTPWAFFGQEALSMLPLSLPIWLAGLWCFFFRPEGKRFRVLAWAWLVTAIVILSISPRIYYLFPAFPLLFAGGAILWETWLTTPRVQWIKPAYASLMIALAALLAPTVIPILPPEMFIRYGQVTHLQQPRIENKDLGPLPQLFADQFGWKEMAEVVAAAYHNLPLDVQTRTAILAQNYGQAGAIDLFGPRYGLPPAISPHQNYFLWGPRGYTGESMIVLDDDPQTLGRLFAEVHKVGRVEHPYSMPYQHFDVYYCRGLKEPLAELWPKLKHWD